MVLATQDSVFIRDATQADIGFSLPLVDAASGGVWPAVWAEMAVDETPSECAARYLADTRHAVSIGGAVIAQRGKKIGRAHV